MNTLLKQMIPASIIRHRLDFKKCILFTFDDGPHPVITPQVLDILDQYGARGLFFIPSSRIVKSPELLKDIINRNHGIGNHSVTHTSCSDLSFSQIINEINGCKDEIFSQCGIVTKHYRPPCGIITPSLLVAAWSTNHKIVRWSISSGEYDTMRNKTPRELADKFLKTFHDRAIVLSHDDKDTTPEFLKFVLPKLMGEGYDLCSGLDSI
jgi:peptidoglycan/xylan/chitin deacetylase (PgdA/CDA1 family)